MRRLVVDIKKDGEDWVGTIDIHDPCYGGDHSGCSMPTRTSIRRDSEMVVQFETGYIVGRILKNIDIEIEFKHYLRNEQDE